MTFIGYTCFTPLTQQGKAIYKDVKLSAETRNSLEKPQIFLIRPGSYVYHIYTVFDLNIFQ